MIHDNVSSYTIIAGDAGTVGERINTHLKEGWLLFGELHVTSPTSAYDHGATEAAKSQSSAIVSRVNVVPPTWSQALIKRRT
jgi:hypothetical protein